MNKSVLYTSESNCRAPATENKEKAYNTNKRRKNINYKGR